MRLTKRDNKILEALHSYDGMLSLGQIDKLFFSGKGRSRPRQRMRILYDNKYVGMPSERTIHRVPLGETIYWLDRRGAEVVAARKGSALSELTWRRRPRWSWIEHDLTVNNFRLQIHHACKSMDDVDLQIWVPETDFLASPDTVRFKDDKEVSHTRQARPDGFFLITRGHTNETRSEEFGFLLEIDMATHSNPSFERNKVRAGLAYLKSKSYERRFGLRYGRWLVVTTTDKRLNHLLGQTERASGKELFYFTTFELLDKATETTHVGILTEPVWLVAGNRKLTALIPEPNVRKSR